MRGVEALGQDLWGSYENLQLGEGPLICDSHSWSAQFPASPGPSEQQPALQRIPLPSLVSAALQRLRSVPSHRPLGETRSSTGPRAGLRDTASSWLPAGLRSARHTSFSLAAQPIFHPPYCPLIQPILHRSDDKDTMGDCVKSLAKVKVYNIHCPLLVQSASYLITESRFLTSSGMV